MNYETKILVLIFTGSVLLAAIYVYLKDSLYVKITGRPASERELDRRERKYHRPVTRPKYIASFAFLVLVTLLSAYSVGWSGDYKGWTKLFPLTRMFSCAYLLYSLQKRWRKQHEADLDVHVSGEAR